jgi:hypothetical protein
MVYRSTPGLIPGRRMFHFVYLISEFFIKLTAIQLQMKALPGTGVAKIPLLLKMPIVGALWAPCLLDDLLKIFFEVTLPEGWQLTIWFDKSHPKLKFNSKLCRNRIQLTNCNGSVAGNT